jgi:4-amino-4-deoxy-L-arabinose transferase-like glycosyltransferase
LDTARRQRRRFPWELLLLAAFASAVYFSRLDALPFRGEETRWARVAWEMRETGDFVVPRQQGHVFPDRPPLNSWLMLLASGLTGNLDRFSVRFPAALATVLTALLVYGYCREFLSRWAAFTAGVVYATFPQTLQLGRFAESDAVFVFFVTASVLVWHTGYVRGWPLARMWIAGYALAAMAGLAKGPQGPAYFVATVAVFLALRRDWRCLFSLGHLAGLVTFAAVLGAWQVPFSLAAGSGASAAVWSEEGTLDKRVAGVFGTMWWRHAATYPVEVFAYLLPWSVFLFAVFRPNLWRPAVGWVSRPVQAVGCVSRPVQDGSGEPSYVAQHIQWLLVYLAVAFPTCWLVSDARPRHLMAIYPAVACLIAAVIEWSCFDRSAQRWDWGFRWFLAVTGAAGTLFGAVLFVAGISAEAAQMTVILSPSWSTAACGAATMVLASVCLWASAGSGPARAAMGIVAVGATLALGFVVLGIDHFARIADDLDAQVARLKTEVLRGERLVSFDPLFHKFTFYYEDPIELLPWPRGELPKDRPWRYFAFIEHQARLNGPIPFAWEEVAVMYCDRAREKGHNIIRVGRPKDR